MLLIHCSESRKSGNIFVVEGTKLTEQGNSLVRLRKLMEKMLCSIECESVSV